MISATTRRALADAGIDPDAVADLVSAAIDEDLAGGVDVTSAATVPATQRGVLDLVARQEGVVAGVPVAMAVFDAVSDVHAPVVTTALVTDGARVDPGTVVLSAAGPTVDLLTGERTALNFLGHLSGVATLTRQWADALRGTRTRVRDTRKTTPLLRAVEKYAVRCGGGLNHRMSLSDAALIKDNHVLAAGGVEAALRAVRDRFPGLPVEVEVDSLEQLAEAIEARADLVLLDNFTIGQVRAAVGMAGAAARRPKLEASGGLRLRDAKAVAATGVDFVAIGALTHSAPVLDIGGDLRMADKATR